MNRKILIQVTAPTVLIGSLLFLACVVCRWYREGETGSPARRAARCGFVLVLASIYGGQAVSHSPSIAPLFTYSGIALAMMLIAYGFAASTLPVWLLLAPRDYLSTFVKLGVVLLLALGILIVRPQLQLPALTRFVDGTGPIFAGKVFPWLYEDYGRITRLRGPVGYWNALALLGDLALPLGLWLATRRRCPARRRRHRGPPAPPCGRPGSESQ